MADLEALRRMIMEVVTAAIQPLKETLDVVNADVATLKNDVAVLKKDVTVLKGDVAVLKDDVAVLKEDVAILRGDVVGLKKDVAIVKKAAEGRGIAQIVRLSNAVKGPTDELTRLTVNYKGDPLPDDVPQPSCWAQLAVGGSESVPFLGRRNSWTRDKSRQLLAAYYCEGGGDDTDGEGEYGKKARGRRLAVAELLGVSAIRLQAASFV